jgi:hypothetical protein
VYWHYCVIKNNAAFYVFHGSYFYDSHDLYSTYRVVTYQSEISLEKLSSVFPDHLPLNKFSKMDNFPFTYYTIPLENSSKKILNSSKFESLKRTEKDKTWIEIHIFLLLFHHNMLFWNNYRECVIFQAQWTMNDVFFRWITGILCFWWNLIEVLELKFYTMGSTKNINIRHSIKYKTVFPLQIFAPFSFSKMFQKYYWYWWELTPDQYKDTF